MALANEPACREEAALAAEVGLRGGSGGLWWGSGGARVNEGGHRQGLRSGTEEESLNDWLGVIDGGEMTTRVFV